MFHKFNLLSSRFLEGEKGSNFVFYVVKGATEENKRVSFKNLICVWFTFFLIP